MRLFMTYLGQDIKFLTQNSPIYDYYLFSFGGRIKSQIHRFNNLWIWDLILPPKLESLTTSKLTDFSVFQKNTQKTYLKQHIIHANSIVIYNVDIYIASKDHMKLFLENVGGKRI